MDRTEKPLLSVVIPVFNEEEGLPALFARLRGVIDNLSNATIEVVFVDDHSRDRSPTLLREACAANPEFRFVRLSANRGSHIAIFAGLSHARGDCAAFLAADLQDPPELLAQMLEAWTAGHHVVWAVREDREGISWTDRILGRAFWRLHNLLSQTSLPPEGSDFALLDRAVIDALFQSVVATPFLFGEIARLGFRSTHVGYTKGAREHGTTKWTLGRKLRLFADAVVADSYVPLRAMSYLGMLCSLGGFIYALIVLLMNILRGSPVTGWASLMVAVLVLGGFQMTMLGVLGEYLWRTLEAARHRPLYFIEENSDSPRRHEPKVKPREEIEPTARKPRSMASREMDVRS